LVRQITTDTLSNKESEAVNILKKHYINGAVSKEYKIYKTLSEAKNLSEAKANVLLEVALESYKRLNKASLKKQKYELISDIKNNYNLDEFFKAKVDNYKTLASIYILFEMYSTDIVNPELETKYRFTIMESISQSPEKEKSDAILEQYNSFDRGTKSLVYKLYIQKFNDKYSDLDDNQKTLLKEYITNISTSNKLRDYVNEEYSRVKKELDKYIKNENNEVRVVKLNEVKNFIDYIPENKQVCEKDIHNLMYYYELIKEYESTK
jgi:hypothetical protein